MTESLTLLVLLILSGFFSGAETALTAISRARVRGLVKDGRHGARNLARLKSNPTRMLITLLIGNNLANISASAIATLIAVRLFDAAGPGIAVGVMTLVVLIFGEVTPKSVAIRHSERISLAVAAPILLMRSALFPMVWALERLTLKITDRPGAKHEPTVTESELISLVEHGEQEGTIESDEREMIERVFAFGDLNVEDVMTPRHEIFALDASRPIREALPEILDEGYSRIPLYEDKHDEIRKVVYVRDLLEAVANNGADAPLRTIGRDPVFVPESQPVDELFAHLRRQKQHLAVVVDEYGGLQGVVTLEDLLEELVGEIYDETDEAPREIERLSGERIAVPGAAEVRVVEEHFGVEIPGKPTDTVSLWILNRAERIPHAGEHFSFDGLDVIVEKASRRRIHQVILSRAPAGHDGAADRAG